MRSGTTSSKGWRVLQGAVANDRDKWSYRLVRRQRTLCQCPGGRSWRPYMNSCCGGLGRCSKMLLIFRACGGCRNRHCILGLGDRECPWCLGHSRVALILAIAAASVVIRHLLRLALRSAISDLGHSVSSVRVNLLALEAASLARMDSHRARQFFGGNITRNANKPSSFRKNAPFVSAALCW